MTAVFFFSQEVFISSTILVEATCAEFDSQPTSVLFFNFGKKTSIFSVFVKVCVSKIQLGTNWLTGTMVCITRVLLHQKIRPYADPTLANRLRQRKKKRLTSHSGKKKTQRGTKISARQGCTQRAIFPC
jgi:hypothetical protein